MILALQGLLRVVARFVYPICFSLIILLSFGRICSNFLSVLVFSGFSQLVAFNSFNSIVGSFRFPAFSVLPFVGVKVVTVPDGLT